MDNLIKLERIGNLCQQLLVLHALNRVTLNGSDIAHALLRHQLEALLVVVVDDVLDDSFSRAHLLQIPEAEQV